MKSAKKHLKDIKRVHDVKENRSDYLCLDKNENIVGFDGEIIDSFRKEINSDFLSGYPQVYPLYERLAQWLGCQEDQVYLTSGSDAAIKAVFETFVEPDDVVLLLNPTYAMFGVYAKIFQASLIEVCYQEDLSLSVSEIMKNIDTSKPKLVCIANPNSPTGTILSAAEVERIAVKTHEYGGIFLLDEAYYIFYMETAIDLITKFPNLVITRTFSKAFGLAALRLGYIAANSQTIESIKKVRPMYEINGVAAKLGELILDNYHIVQKNLEEIRLGKIYLEKELGKMGLTYYPSYANFLLINIGSVEECMRIGQALKQKKILIKYGFEGILQKYIRVSIGSREQMKGFLKTLTKIIDCGSNKG